MVLCLFLVRRSDCALSRIFKLHCLIFTHNEVRCSTVRGRKALLVVIVGDPNSGWSDPIGTFISLQLAVRILASGDGPRKVRLDEATFALTGLVPGYFPVALRE